MFEDNPQTTPNQGALSFPLNFNDQKIIEKTKFDELNISKIKGGFPVSTTVPDHVGTQGEMVEVDDGTLYCYINGSWIQIGGSSLTYYEAFANKFSGKTTDSDWQDLDISSAVASGTKYAEMRISNIGASVGIAGVHKIGGNDSRVFAIGANYDNLSVMVEVDSNRKIRIKSNNDDLNFFVIGYWK